MIRSKGALRWGANFVALSAGLHILALIVGGFSAEALRLLSFGIVYAGFVYGLLQGWRWLAYIVFIVLLTGTSLALSNIELSAGFFWQRQTRVPRANFGCLLNSVIGTR